MQSIFNFFVIVFQDLSQRMGLTYEAFNILIYCLLVPATWISIVLLRTRKGILPFLLHWLAPIAFWWFRRPLKEISIQFYNANVMALDWWGQKSAWGYVGVSVLIGVLIPVLIYGALLLLPRRWVMGYYVFLMVVSLGYYGWVCRHF
ncbi:MAG: hypothetical protein WCR52_16360 [Bacteroidota bacterium]